MRRELHGQWYRNRLVLLVCPYSGLRDAVHLARLAADQWRGGSDESMKPAPDAEQGLGRGRAWRRRSSDVGLLVRLARLYGHYAPVDRGKRRLAAIALRRGRTPPGPTVVTALDGARFSIDLRDNIYHELYFLGSYEPSVTEAVRKLLRHGDHALDIGANFGWFTILFDRQVGPTGAVDSFEPVPRIYAKLLETIESNGTRSRLRTHQCCLGDHEGTVEIYSFVGMSHGHSSVSTLGRDDYEAAPAQVRTLDSYWASLGEPDIAFIKCDVEGSELAVLRGARRLLMSDRPPIWLLEANEDTSAALGYQPGQLLTELQAYGYEYVVLRRGHRKPLGAVSLVHADSIIAFRPKLHGDRIASLLGRRADGVVATQQWRFYPLLRVRSRRAGRSTDS